jgi:hypothetical protein
MAARAQGLICHVIWILACISLFIINYKAKIFVINEEKILKYLTTELFVVVTYFFIVTSLIACFCMLADTDMHFLHCVLILVIVTSPISRRANSA